MRPLFAVGPAALMRLFQEELLVRVDPVVHETRELVFYCLELVVGHRLRDCSERTSRRGAEAQPCGGAQESHALAMVLLTAGRT